MDDERLPQKATECAPKLKETNEIETELSRELKRSAITPSSIKFVVSTIAYVPDYEDQNDSSDEEDDNTFTRELGIITTDPTSFPFKIKQSGSFKGVYDKMEDCKDTNDPVPANYTSRVIEPFLTKLQTTGFAQSDKEKYNQIKVSLALNRMKSLSKRRNKSLYYEMKSVINGVTVKNTYFCFFWMCKWEDVEEKDVDMRTVEKFYKQLKNKDRVLAEHFLNFNEKKTEVPYTWLREKAKDHLQTKHLVTEFSTNLQNDIYFTLIDSDTVDFNSVFSTYLKSYETRLNQQNGCPPTVMTTGYTFGEDPQFGKVYQYIGSLDRNVRIVTANPLSQGVYYPEPNMCILIPKKELTLPESFLKKSKLPPYAGESSNLLKDIIAKRNIEDFATHFIFIKDNPIYTQIPPRFYYYKNSPKEKKSIIPFSEKFKANGTPTEQDFKWIDMVFQSNTSNRTWAQNLFVNDAIKTKYASYTHAKQKCEGLIMNACDSLSQLNDLLLNPDDFKNILTAIQERAILLSKHKGSCIASCDEKRLKQLLKNYRIDPKCLFSKKRDSQRIEKIKVLSNTDVLELFEKGILSNEHLLLCIKPTFLKAEILEKIFVVDVLDGLRAGEIVSNELFALVQYDGFLDICFDSDELTIPQILKVFKENPTFIDIIAGYKNLVQPVIENIEDEEFVKCMINVFVNVDMFALAVNWDIDDEYPLFQKLADVYETDPSYIQLLSSQDLVDAVYVNSNNSGFVKCVLDVFGDDIDIDEVKHLLSTAAICDEGKFMRYEECGENELANFNNLLREIGYGSNSDNGEYSSGPDNDEPLDEDWDVESQD